MIESYPSVYQMGHKAAENIFDGIVVVQEKIDGSQFSFGFTDDVLQIRSKGQMIDPEVPPKMFAKAVQTVKDIEGALLPGVIYRGEVLDKPKHNTIAYERIPIRNIILYDISLGGENYATPDQVRIQGAALGLEVVKTFFEGEITGKRLDSFLKLIPETWSVLGENVPIEGFVFKNYNQFGVDKKMLMCKLTSTEFKERNQAEWTKPSRADVVEVIGLALNTEARFNKTIQYLRDADQLSGEPRDIGPLMKELQQDLEKEESDFIKDKLYTHFKKDIFVKATRGFPEYYKQKLMEGIRDAE